METSTPMARSEYFDLPHIGINKLQNMNEVVKKSFLEKQKLMVEVFNSLKKGTTFQVIEKNQQNQDNTDVILRQDNGSGGGNKGPRFPHGTMTELVSSQGRQNTNGYSFRTMKDSKGQERIYVQVKISGQTGYMAIEHIGIRDIPLPVVPTVDEDKKKEEPKTTAEPTVDEDKKKEEPNTTAEPTVDEAKKKEEPKTTAEPTVDDDKKPDETNTTAEPTVDDDKKPDETNTTAEPTENNESTNTDTIRNLLVTLQSNVTERELLSRLNFIGKPFSTEVTLQNFINAYNGSIKNIQINQDNNTVMLTLINDTEIPFYE